MLTKRRHTVIFSERLQLLVVGCVVVLHIDNLVPFRPGLERVEKFLGKRDGRVPKQEVGGGSERQD